MPAPPTALAQRRSTIIAAVILGVGLGGFFDGIVLHQILQWHHMLSSIYPPDPVENIRINTSADGLFHAATWIVTVFGVLQLARAHRGGTPDQRSRILVADDDD